MEQPCFGVAKDPIIFVCINIVKRNSLIILTDVNVYPLAVGMRNSIVNTYLIDEMEEQKVINFRSFMRDKWDLWMGKCIIRSYNIL